MAFAVDKVRIRPARVTDAEQLAALTRELGYTTKPQEIVTRIEKASTSFAWKPGSLSASATAGTPFAGVQGGGRRDTVARSTQRPSAAAQPIRLSA